MSEENKAKLDSCDEQVTMRDMFACAALEGISANPEMAHYDFDRIAKMAYKQADEMLKARKQ